MRAKENGLIAGGVSEAVDGADVTFCTTTETNHR
jgi:hypothetical protein